MLVLVLRLMLPLVLIPLPLMLLLMLLLLQAVPLLQSLPAIVLVICSPWGLLLA
jgi:hypothetical protein